MQALPSGHKINEIPPSFPCAACDLPILDHHYAVRSDDNEMVCYQCAYNADLAQAAQTGKLSAYIDAEHIGSALYNTTRPPIGKLKAITNWPGLPFTAAPPHITGRYRSNFGDRRITFTCKLPTGTPTTPPVPRNQDVSLWQWWYGTYYADAGDYCRLTRNKNQECAK